MNVTYKDSQTTSNFLQKQFLKDRTQKFFNQYKLMVQEKLNELIDLYSQNNENSIKQYIEICYRFSFSCTGPMPKEFFISPEFIDLINFICQVLNQTTNVDIILCNLSLVRNIIGQSYSTVKEFENKGICPILFKFIQSDRNNIIDSSIMCISYLIKGTDDISIYEPFMDNQLLHDISSKSPEIKASVLSFCSSVLNRCDHYFIYRDILIQLGLEIFEFGDGNELEFLSSLRRILKICPTPNDIFQLFQPDSTDSFLYSIAEWINPDIYSSASLSVLKLFYTMIKYVKESYQIIKSCIGNFQENIVRICHEQQSDPSIISISYKILKIIIPSNCAIIKQLLDIDKAENIYFPIILENLKEGNFPLRKSAINLSTTIMKWGTIFPQTNSFYSTEFIEIISSILFTDEEELIISALGSLKMIAEKASNESITDITSIFHDQAFQEQLEYLKNKYENNDIISNLLYHIAKEIQTTNEI